MKVTRILDPEFKSGRSQTGKPWKLVKIEVGDKQATGFGPVHVGDEVDLTYDEKYKNYGFRVLRPNDIPASSAPTQSPPSDGLKLLQLTYENTQQILSLLETKNQSLGDTWRETTGQTAETVVEDIGDEPINVDDIPF